MKLLLAVAVLGLCAVYCAADEEEKHECGLLERVMIRRQWPQAFGEGTDRLEFALHLFSSTFRHYPKAREMFSKFRGDNIYSPEFQAKAQRILNNFGMLVATTDEPETLKVLLEYVKNDLAEKGVKGEFYEPFRDELLETLQEKLETHVAWDAWYPCINTLIEKLK